MCVCTVCVRDGRRPGGGLCVYELGGVIHFPFSLIEG